MTSIYQLVWLGYRLFEKVQIAARCTFTNLELDCLAYKTMYYNQITAKKDGPVCDNCYAKFMQ